MKDKIVLIILAALMFGLGIMCMLTHNYIVGIADFCVAGLDLYAALRRR